ACVTLALVASADHASGGTPRIRRGVTVRKLMRQRGWSSGAIVLAALLLVSVFASPVLARAAAPTSAEVALQTGCPTPRPPVQTHPATLSGGRIQVTILPGFGVLRRIKLGTAQHAQILLPGQSQGIVGNQDVELQPGTTSYSFVLVADATAGVGQA